MLSQTKPTQTHLMLAFFLYTVTRRCMSVPRRTLHQCIIHVSLNSLSKVLRCEQKYLNHSCLIVSECLEAIHVYIVVLKSRILLRWMLFPGSKYRSHTSKTAFFLYMYNGSARFRYYKLIIVKLVVALKSRCLRLSVFVYTNKRRKSIL